MTVHDKHIGLFTIYTTLYPYEVHYKCTEFNVLVVVSTNVARVRYYIETEDSYLLVYHLANLDNYPLKDVTKELLSLSILRCAK